VRVVTVYSRPDCHLCVAAIKTLREMQVELAFTLAEVDIETDDSLHRAYLERIPVIALDGEELFDYVVDQAALRERLGQAAAAGAKGSIL
jgi:glutaredoxin